MAAPRSKNPIIALLVALAGLAVAVFVGTQGGDDAAATSAPTSSTSVAAPTATAAPQVKGVPQVAWTTLAAIDAGRWPPDNAPGTQGGRTFGNYEGRLPASSSGQKVRYREWDVNRKQDGRGRDAERIVTGSDGSAWYTGDHYETFTRMR